MAEKKKKSIFLVIVLLIIVILGAAATLIWGYFKAEASGVWNPVITLSEPQKVVLRLGDAYSEPGFTATDTDGNDLSYKVESKVPDLNRAGSYAITYKVTDDKGRTASTERILQILPNTKNKTAGLPICMYHYVYDKNNPPADLNSKYSNYIEVGQLREELYYLKQNNYYFPTWKEVREYIDGTLILPEKSIVLSFDDGAKSFLELGIPLLEQYQVPATSFMITGNKGREKIAQYKNKYVTFESHSHKMHRPGGNIGHGGIFPVMSEADALADLNRSVEICGSGDALAYPYGDYTERCGSIVRAAGFLCAVTTEYGLAKPGDDPYKLPRVRMSNGQSLEVFQGLIQGKL